jgi:uncharacterized membrane protein
MLFSKEEESHITKAIRHAERATTGEIRVYVEDFCLRDQPVERAAEIFQLFGMFNTTNRNAVLIYLAPKSRHFAIWGDSGIHQQVGFHFWGAEKQVLREHLQRDEFAKGICTVIHQIGDKLRTHFPSKDEHTANELPDEIIYG